MINLLPPELKSDYRFARHNSALLRVVSSFGFGAIGLAIIVTAGIFYLHQSAKNYNAQSAQIGGSLNSHKQVEVEKQVQDISGSLKLAVEVLSKEVLFSELLKQLAVVTPSNVSLSSVNINEFGGGIDVSADAADYNAATQLQINLADPTNKIFTKADIVNITCESDVVNVRYPCSVTVRALFSQDNPFLFINGKMGGQ